MDRKRKTARQLAHQFLNKGDALGWFETLYALAEGDPEIIPWADLRPNTNLIDWFAANAVQGSGQRALKIGCGLGDDAEALAELGFEVTAFDISKSAIDWCRNRFPDSRVDYRQQDLFQSPQNWNQAFDLVIESYTLQVLPPDLRPKAQDCISRFLAPAGLLLAICRGREADEDAGRMPWPLLKGELHRFTDLGLTEQSFEDFLDAEAPPVRRFRAVYRR